MFKIIPAAVLCGLLNLFCSPLLNAQQDSASAERPFKPGRFAAVVTTETAIATTTLIGLNELWYKDYPRSSFHFFNDNAEWLQVDKFGHAYTAYQVGHLGYAALRWSGVKEKPSAWYGGATGFAYQLIVEMLDGYSKQWGFSLGDFAGNLGGAALFTSQQLLWHDQKILMKYSYHFSPYAQYHPELLGSTVPERILKDYNGQTYWLSVSPGSFLKNKQKFPPWICFSVGMSANGMLGARDNDGYTGICPDHLRNRRILLSMDVDLSKIPVKSRFWHTVLSFINSVKMPFPALEYQTNSKQIIVNWMYL